MGANTGLIETTCKELLKFWILTNLNIRILFKIWMCRDNEGHRLSLSTSSSVRKDTATAYLSRIY